MADPNQRLGANGVEEIKQHPFFASIDWDRLAHLEVKPPFVPDVRPLMFYLCMYTFMRVCVCACVHVCGSLFF